MTALFIGLFAGVYLLANIILLQMYLAEEEADTFDIAILLVLGTPIVLIGAVVAFIEEMRKKR